MASVTTESKLVVTVESTGADDTKAQLEALKSTMQADALEIANLRRALGNLKGTTGANSDEAKRLKEALAAKREAMAQNQKQYTSMGGALSSLFAKQAAGTAATAQASAGLKALTSELSRASPAAAGLFSKVALLGAGWLGAAAAAVALTLAVAGLSAGLVVGTHVAYGLAVGDAARTERLMLEGLVRARGSLAGSEQMATGFAQAIGRVARDVPLARSEVNEMAKGLWNMRLRGDALEKMLRGMALAKSVGHDFWSLGMNVNMAGRNMLSLAKEAEKRFGPVVAKQMLSLTVQSAKLKEAFRNLFAGVDVSLLGGMMATLTKQLQETEVVGYALKQTLTAVFRAFTGDATEATPAIQVLLEELTIGALVGTMAIMKLRRSFADWYQQIDEASTSEALKTTLVWIGAAMGTAAFMTMAFAGALAMVGASIAAPVAAVTAGLMLIQLAINRLRKIDMSEVAAELLRGLGQGIIAGAKWVTDAVSQLGEKVKTAFKSALKIASRSKVFYGYGHNIAEGAEGGVREGSRGVQQAVTAMVTLPKSSSVAGTPRDAPAPITIGPFIIQSATDKPEDLAALIRLELEKAVEQACKMLGVEPGAATYA